MTAAYVTAAVDGTLSRMAAARSGRSHAIFSGACALGELVGAGVLGREQAESLLIEAGVSTGKPEREVRGHVQRGLRRGMASPRELPDRVAPVAATDARRTGSSVARSAAPHRHPPAPAVQTLWTDASPVTADDAIAQYLGAVRGIDPDLVQLWDLARVIPATGTLPGWAHHAGQCWRQSGHRLLLGTFGAAGRLASLRARYVGKGPQERKTLAPAGFTTKGLVLACPLAVQVLRDGPPAWGSTRDIVIAEGDMDFLTWATQQRECDENGPAVFGITSGAWTRAIADRIPDGARVVIRTHRDAAGESYARQIHDTIQGRCTVLRPRSEASA